MPTTKAADPGESRPLERSRFTRHIDRLIMRSGKQQNIIAREMGYDRPNIISMFKQGTSRVPLDKVPALAMSVGASQVDLLNLWLAEYEPGMLKVLHEHRGPSLSGNEQGWLGLLRRLFPGEVPGCDGRHEAALTRFAEDEAKKWAGLDRDIELNRKRKGRRPGDDEGGVAVGAMSPVAAVAMDAASGDPDSGAGSEAGADGADSGRVTSSTAPDAPQPLPGGRHDPDENAVLSHRYREATLMGIARAAKARGITQKQLLSLALTSIGVEVHPADRGMRAPARRRADEV